MDTLILIAENNIQCILRYFIIYYINNINVNQG
jgi:hypothetical protein